VLSAYLPTPPVHVAGEAYLVLFREQAKSIRAALEEAPDEELRAFEAAFNRIQTYLSDQFSPRHQGVAIFAAEQPEYLYAVPLPSRPITLVAWDPLPLLAPLEEVLDEFERVAVAVFDRSRARLLTIYLGEIEEQQVLESEPPVTDEDSEWGGSARPGRRRHHAASRRLPPAARSQGMAEASAASYESDRLVRHARRSGHALMEMLHARPFDRLLLAGPPEARAILERELPRPLRARYAGPLTLEANATDPVLREAVNAAAAAIERREEVALVDALVDAATSPRVALGMAAVLEAISEQRVHQLVLADEFTGIGGECPTCGRLVPGLDLCPNCGTKPDPLPDLRERLIDRALEQGARVETVYGDAAALLMVHGGLGAWTRY
jgi:peptide subunit release factor 1 (eRF1)